MIPSELAAETNWKIERASSSTAVGVAFVVESDSVVSAGVRDGDVCVWGEASWPVTLMMLPSSRERMSVEWTFGRLERDERVEEMVGGSFCDTHAMLARLWSLQRDISRKVPFGASYRSGLAHDVCSQSGPLRSQSQRM